MNDSNDSIHRMLHRSKRFRPLLALCAAGLLTITAAGCHSKLRSIEHLRPDIRPTEASLPADSLLLDSSNVEPMYQQLLPIDLYAVIRVAAAENIDIRLARYQVEQSKGRYESAVGAVFPVIVPTALFEHFDGSKRATEGNIVNAGFNTFNPSIALEWVINPGKVIYEIIAAKKRLRASEDQERAVQMETLRTASIQFYDLVLRQAHVTAAFQAVAEAIELLRINQLRAKTGTGVPADELRAEARLAERQQDLATAMNELYQASLALAVTLQLADPTVTLIPKLDELPPIELVNDSIQIDQLLAYAVEYRPDLQGVRRLMEAADADRGATWWGGFGPQFSTRYEYGGITGNANNTNLGTGIPSFLIVNPASSNGRFASNPVGNGLIREGIRHGGLRADHNRDETFSFSDEQHVNASLGARWSISAFGDLKAAAAAGEQAALAAERKITEVKVQVIAAQQTSRTNRKLISLAKHQMVAAAEALRLAQASLQAGAMTTLDVLQSQDAVAQARLRYAKAVVRFNQAEVDLLASIGLLNVNTLALINNENRRKESDPLDG